MNSKKPTNKNSEDALSPFKASLDESHYRWNPEIILNITALPTQIIDSELKFATGDQVKALLWICRNISSKFSAQQCSKDTGVKQSTCIDALNYWISRGIVLPLSGIMPQQSLSSGNDSQPNSSTLNTGKFEKSLAESVFSGPKYTSRIRTSKPSTKDVIERQRTNEEFAFLLRESSARLGKPINHGDMETLLYLFETVGQPVAVILLITAYAVSQNKGNMRYIERVAIDWSDREINTVESAEQQLCAMERRTSSWECVCVALGIDKRPTASEMNASERWIYEWKFDIDIIKVAHQVCMSKIDKFRSSYIDKILSGWHLDGVNTVEKALEQLDPKKSFGGKKKVIEKSSKAISFDFDEYEDMVDNFVPIYKKTKTDK